MSLLISIVMPTLNSEKYLLDSLESLKRQTYENYELLVCDAGSCDNTLQSIQNQMGAKAKIVSRSDSGIPDALNKGFNAATGEILCWLNSDDVLLSPFVLETVKTFFSASQSDVALGDFATLDSDGYILKTHISILPFNRRLSNGANIFTGSLFFRRTVWANVGEFSKCFHLGFEYELLKKLTAKYRIMRINKTLGGFRLHSMSLSCRYSSIMKTEAEALHGVPTRGTALLSFLDKFLSLVWHRTLFLAIRTRYFDTNRGKHWFQVENRY
jgi:glycosyltransferase involved in cell wall biosynthesis